MLDSHRAQGGRDERQGCRDVSLADLRCAVASPSDLSESCRQRLVDLARRLHRIQGLEDEYTQVELSEYVTVAMDRAVVAV